MAGKVSKPLNFSLLDKRTLLCLTCHIAWEGVPEAARPTWAKMMSQVKEPMLSQVYPEESQFHASALR